MMMDAKRWPPEHFAALADRLARKLDTQVILLGGPNDTDIIDAVRSRMATPAAALVGTLSFAEIALLASRSRLYVGNDTGLTHLAAAAGAPTAAIFGPSDPRRYALFAPNTLTLWKPAAVQQTGVATGTPPGWDWSRDGIGVDEVEQAILDFLAPDDSQ
jgi:ADP-heptose:LPS heptosyltransferase